MFHCPVGVWVIEPHALMVSATVRSPTLVKPQSSRSPLKYEDQRQQGTRKVAMQWTRLPITLANTLPTLNQDSRFKNCLLQIQ